MPQPQAQPQLLDTVAAPGAGGAQAPELGAALSQQLPPWMPTEQSPPKDDRELGQREAGWSQFFSNPQVMMALGAFGASLAQPRRRGQTAGGHFAEAASYGLAAGGSAQARQQRGQEAPSVSARNAAQTELLKAKTARLKGGGAAAASGGSVDPLLEEKRARLVSQTGASDALAQQRLQGQDPGIQTLTQQILQARLAKLKAGPAGPSPDPNADVRRQLLEARVAATQRSNQPRAPDAPGEAKLTPLDREQVKAMASAYEVSPPFVSKFPGAPGVSAEAVHARALQQAEKDFRQYGGPPPQVAGVSAPSTAAHRLEPGKGLVAGTEAPGAQGVPQAPGAGNPAHAVMADQALQVMNTVKSTAAPGGEALGALGPHLQQYDTKTKQRMLDEQIARLTAAKKGTGTTELDDLLAQLMEARKGIK